MSRREHKKQMQAIIGRTFDNHVMNEVRESRSFHFNNVRLYPSMDILPDGAVIQKMKMERCSAYHFGLTWRPGYLILTGDLGELTICHYNALAQFIDISWALSSDHDYLMSKTNVRREYDRDAQVKHLREWANEEVIEFLNGTSSTWWLKDPVTGVPTKTTSRRHGLRQELQQWRKEAAAGRDEHAAAYALWLEDSACDDHEKEPSPALEDFIDEKPEDDGITPRPLARYDSDLLRRLERHDRHEVLNHYHVPDHWVRWAMLWYEAGECGEITEILKASGRYGIMEELEGILENANDAADLYYSKLGYDDFSTQEKWNERTYWQIAAIQHGVKMILDKEFPDV